jgi:hypothetical protein
MRVWIAAVLSIFIATVYAQSGAERSYSLSDDNALWDEAELVEDRYQEAPVDWYGVNDNALKTTLYFPCKPDDAPARVEGHRSAQFSCNFGDRIYVANFQANHLPNIDMQLKFLIGAVRDVTKSLQQAGVAPTVEPIKRVIYGDARGRQVRIISADVEMEMRLLYRPGFILMLGVRDEPGQLTESQDPFFNAVKLK